MGILSLMSPSGNSTCRSPRRHSPENPSSNVSVKRVFYVYERTLLVTHIPLWRVPAGRRQGPRPRPQPRAAAPGDLDQHLRRAERASPAAPRGGSGVGRPRARRVTPQALVGMLGAPAPPDAKLAGRTRRPGVVVGLCPDGGRRRRAPRLSTLIQNRGNLNRWSTLTSWGARLGIDRQEPVWMRVRGAVVKAVSPAKRGPSVARSLDDGEQTRRLAV